MKSGFVGVIGRPNVGKSTLINNIIGHKIAITSNKPQTTRNIIQGIYNKDDVQIIFIDTPGIHKPKYKLGNVLNKQAYFSMNDADVILLLVDINEPLGKGDKFVIEKLKEIDKPVFLLLNKIDRIDRLEILKKIDEYQKLYDFAEIVPISALKSDNVEHLIEVIKKYLNDNIKYYDDDMITNVSTKFIISELIREKILILTEEEVPHSVTCIVDQIEEDKKVISISATIVVDRESLKKIIVGKNGNMIKTIGTKARKEIEQMLNKQVYLDLFVKVIPKWRDREKFLNEIGYNDFQNDV